MIVVADRRRPAASSSQGVVIRRRAVLRGIRVAGGRAQSPDVDGRMGMTNFNSVVVNDPALEVRGLPKGYGNASVD